jgi:transcriptional regulator with XRE-family HTH domain
MHRIREILKQKNWTQAELARRMNTSEENVSRKLKGERKIKLQDLFEFAEALEVPAFQLVAGSEDAELLGAEQRAILRAFNALDRAGQLAMLAEFANAALQDARPADGPARPPRHALPKH